MLDFPNQIGLVPVDRSIADCPLQSVDVKAKMDDTLSEVTISQTYENKGSDPIEAVYKFPLPHEAKVTGFTAKFGDKEIKGEFCEHDKAILDYDKAITSGNSALLLEQRRNDIFEVSLGNIAPGEKVCITFSFIQEIVVTDDEIRWNLPTVIAPRYTPADGGLTEKQDRDEVSVTIGEAPYTLSFCAEWSSPQGIQSVQSPSHKLTIEQTDSRWLIRLAEDGVTLDRDFILIAKRSGDTPNLVSVIKQPDQQLARVKFRLESSADYVQKNAEYVFLIDVSGSMSGEKLEQAKTALQLALRNMESGDYFNIIAFESRFISYNESSVIYSQDELDRASRWVQKLSPRGGTEIYAPLQQVLKHSKRIEELEKIVMLFTDGEVSNEAQVIRLIEENNRHTRLYSFGIDTAVNRLFIDGIAKAGNGISEYVYPGERIEDKVIRQLSRVHAQSVVQPKITGVNGKTLTFIGAAPARFYADEQYDLILEAPLEADLSSLMIQGAFGDVSDWSYELPVSKEGDAQLMSLHWAKQKIDELQKRLEDRSLSTKLRTALERSIINLSVTYGLMSKYTALIAVVERDQTLNGSPKKMIVPVSMPHQWQPHHEIDYLIRDSSHYNFTGPMMLGSVMASPPLPKQSKNLFSMVFENFSDVSSEIMSSSNIREVSYEYAEKLETSKPENRLRQIASKQNADGSMGRNHKVLEQTAWMVIGFLQYAEPVWQMYRKQLEKAGKWLLQAATPVNERQQLLIAVAVQQLIQQNMIKSEVNRTQFVQISNNLSAKELLVLEAVKNKQMEPLFEYMEWDDFIDDEGPAFILSLIEV